MKKRRNGKKQMTEGEMLCPSVNCVNLSFCAAAKNLTLRQINSEARVGTDILVRPRANAVRPYGDGTELREAPRCGSPVETSAYESMQKRNRAGRRDLAPTDSDFLHVVGRGYSPVRGNVCGADKRVMAKP